MNEKVTNDDIAFLDTFFSEEELSDDLLKELDSRLKDPNFKSYYQDRLNQEFKTTPLKLFVAYLPMIILISLTIVGVYLILK